MNTIKRIAILLLLSLAATWADPPKKPSFSERNEAIAVVFADFVKDYKGINYFLVAMKEEDVNQLRSILGNDNILSTRATGDLVRKRYFNKYGIRIHIEIARIGAHSATVYAATHMSNASDSIDKFLLRRRGTRWIIKRRIPLSSVDR